jgi:pyruvate formate lyase activating enzyme
VNWALASDSPETCASVCPTGALTVFGRTMTVAEVMDKLDQDGAFDRDSAGLTLSGGECLLQPEFCIGLLIEARARGLNTALETAGNVPWRSMEMVLSHVDIVLHDHKHCDPVHHKLWTGANNNSIQQNYLKAYETFPRTRFIARTPIIAGVNDTEEHVRAVLAFIRPHPNVVDYELLPYHRYGINKYGYLGRVYELADFPPPASETLRHLRQIIADAFGRSNPTAPTAGSSTMKVAALRH